MIKFDKTTKDILREYPCFDCSFRIVTVRVLGKLKTICNLSFLNDFNDMEKISL